MSHGCEWEWRCLLIYTAHSEQAPFISTLLCWNLSPSTHPHSEWHHHTHANTSTRQLDSLTKTAGCTSSPHTLRTNTEDCLTLMKCCQHTAITPTLDRNKISVHLHSGSEVIYGEISYTASSFSPIHSFIPHSLDNISLSEPDIHRRSSYNQMDRGHVVSHKWSGE